MRILGIILGLLIAAALMFAIYLNSSLITLSLADANGMLIAPWPADAERPKLRLELRAEQADFAQDDLPLFTAELISEDTRPIPIVLPGDGSNCGRRTPILRWSVPEQFSPRCGNINCLRREEIVLLEPGQRLTFGGLWCPLDGPGKHKVTLELENVPSMEFRGIPLGVHDPVAMANVRRTAPFKVVSNVVEFEWVR